MPDCSPPPHNACPLFIFTVAILVVSVDELWSSTSHLLGSLQPQLSVVAALSIVSLASISEGASQTYVLESTQAR